MKKGMMSLFALLVSGTVSAQTLEKMQWFNEPMGDQRQKTHAVRHTAKRLLAHRTLWLHRG